MEARSASLILILTLIWITDTFGQVAVRGRIKTSDQPLPHASILLLRSDSSVIKGMETDVNGEFRFEKIAEGSYLVSSTLIGYATFVSATILVKDVDVILNDIVLEKESLAMSAVIVRAKKPMFEQKMDRVVVNVQSSLNSSGGTILDVLKKSPGVIIDNQNGTISMNGKSGVQIMMNGKLMQLPFDVVLQMLDGMTSANVDKIELIATPPAKYGAEGNAGVINIITKTNTDLGTSGSFGLTLGYKFEKTLGGNFSLSHRNKNLAFFVDYSNVSNRNRHTFEFFRETFHNGFNRIVTDESKRPNLTNQQNLSTGFEWNPGKKLTLNLGLTGYRRNWTLDAGNTDKNIAGPDSIVITDIKIHESNIWQGATVAFGIQKTINAKQELSFNADYLYYHNDNPSSYDSEVFDDHVNVNEVSKIDLKKKTPIKVFIAKVDHRYIHSPTFSLEAGIKGVTSRLDNNVSVRNFINEQWVTDSFFTSSSTLHEQIGAAYISSKWNPANQWEVNMGLRYEYTHTTIGSPEQKNIVNRKYGYLFPTMIVKRELNKEKDITFSYIRRITRPTYNDIAPYVFFWGPSTFSSGNTSLKPAVSDAVKTSYRIKRWMISFQFSHIQNEITTYQAEIDSATDNIMLRSQNLRYLNTFGLSSSYAFNVTSWWNIQHSITAQYQVAQSTHLKHNPKMFLNSVNFSVINSLVLPRKYSIEISGIYQSKSLTGVANFLSRGSLNAAIQKKLGNGGTFTFAMDDILYTDLWRIKTVSPENNLNSYFRYDFHNQFTRLTYTKKIGNNKLRSVKLKSGSEEERGRLAN